MCFLSAWIWGTKMHCFARCQPSCASPLLETTSLVNCNSACRSSQNVRLLRGSLAVLTPAIAAALVCLVNPKTAVAQDSEVKELPPVVVEAPENQPKRAPTKRIVPTRAVSSHGTGRTNRPAQEAAITGAGAPTPAQAALNAKMQGFDQSRDHILPKFGATSYTVPREAIETMPLSTYTHSLSI